MDFSSYYYRVAICYPTNSLRHLSIHNIHHNASSVPGVFFYDLTFVVACRVSMTNSRYPNTQGEAEMWYPTIQAMIGKLYVLSHFYNMYVVPQAASVHIMFTTLFRFRSNSRPLIVGEQERPSAASTAYVYTLTVPALHGPSTSALSAPEEHPSEFHADALGRTDGA